MAIEHFYNFPICSIYCKELDKTFPSLIEAAYYFKVPVKMIFKAMIDSEFAVLDKYHFHITDNFFRNAYKRPVRIKESGLVFSSANDCAINFFGNRNLAKSITRSCLDGAPFRGMHFYFLDSLEPELIEFNRTNSHSTKKRAVRNITTDEVFESIADASRSVGAKQTGNLRSAIVSSRPYKGCLWEYVDGKPINSGQLIGLGSRPVVCVETREEFQSVSEAAKHVGIKSGSTLSHAIRVGGKCGGFHWEYKNSIDDDRSK